MFSENFWEVTEFFSETWKLTEYNVSENPDICLNVLRKYSEEQRSHNMISNEMMMQYQIIRSNLDGQPPSHYAFVRALFKSHENRKSAS